MLILAFDPSGSFKYGSGTSGWCFVNSSNNQIIDLGNIKAKKYKTRKEYFEEHINILKKWSIDVLVVENFILYKSSANSMLNQELETSELIGYICGVAEEMNIKIVRQNAQVIKTILKKNNVLQDIINKINKQIEFKTKKTDRVQWYFRGTRISNHIVDALRHAYFYITKEKQK